MSEQTKREYMIPVMVRVTVWGEGPVDEQQGREIAAGEVAERAVLDQGFQFGNTVLPVYATLHVTP